MTHLLKPSFIVVAITFALGTLASGQKAETGFLDRSVVVSGVEYRYQVYIPRGFSKKQHWPVIVALHGGGEYGSDGMSQTNVGLAPAIRRNPELSRDRDLSSSKG